MRETIRSRARSRLATLKMEGQRQASDFLHYAETCLKIRSTSGAIIPFVLSSEQHHIHECLEPQREKTGRVRALILKARQLGCSTYIGGRFYHQTTHRKGIRAFILTHEQDATENLFGITDRYHEHCPDSLKPQTGAANAKELSFDLLDSGYRVGTAGTKGVGRSQTLQLFHGSEVAYWPNAETHIDGILQAVPDEPGTEIILESTANGVGGLFYSMCKAAERDEGDYILIFLAWFRHEKYRRPPPDDWTPPGEFAEYGELHGLDREQLYWAFAKNREIAQSISADPDKTIWKFKREYPATAVEAFQTAGDATFINPESVMRARKHQVDVDDQTPLVVGVDPARGDGDKTRIIDRQGRRLGGRVDFVMDTDDTMTVAGEVARMINKIKPKAVFIDVTGLGAGIYDRLRELGYNDIVYGINFAQKAVQAEKFANKRAEIWDELRQ